MDDTERDELLTEARRLRAGGELDAARGLFLRLAAARPGDAPLAYETADLHDRLGLEAEAVPHYERSLTTPDALPEEDRRGAFLGLGSTYRVLGRHRDAERTLREGVRRFPEDGGLRAFLAMALYNTGAHHEATTLLLRLLAETSTDPSVREYRRALLHYANDLDATV
ncbi:tetratricopeptide repeat protein [Streptomyces physcomitrii]|uniref:Tetratricopeptide repeat protein n=1 Tax=Streptomyces physcomitrii TaxID=2724184 RepID=A0ABX1H0T0_9ACTN|nr:tetratricopeptide repeat protein [Streptomyces physcomitrii]NKI41648.1 tetratricopeptide repeat protein [Streptomyces physcomitrii]